MVKLMAFMICLYHANTMTAELQRGFLYIFFQDKGNKLTNII